MPPAPKRAAPRREVRLALVMNGGVSLAVWMGGLTQEIDQLRLGSEAPERSHDLGRTGELYRRLLEILEERVRVDVISGASAGGINGILLGAAIFSGKALPASLREIWISLGDFKKLLRSPALRDPPSIMQGDETVLPELVRALSDLYAGWEGRDRPEHLFLYVTATDLYGKHKLHADSTGRHFEEHEHRRVFTFDHVEDGDAGAPPEAEKGVMRARVRFADDDAVELLARAARSSSSFPVAFEPHRLKVADGKGEISERWLIDGGLLDNQPFNPVLDRISVLPSSTPVRRVVAYIVPYVNEPAVTIPARAGAPPADTSAREVFAATSALPRTLPKLDSLERVRRERRAQRIAEDDRRRIWRLGREPLVEAAEKLLPAYRGTRHEAILLTFSQWASPDFVPGEGVVAQDPTIEPRELAGSVPDAADAPPLGSPWVPDAFAWADDDAWRWGFAPAERVASWALLFLREADPSKRSVQEARSRASTLILTIRRRKRALVDSFLGSDADDLLERGHEAYEAQRGELEKVQEELLALDQQLKAVGGDTPDVHALLALEVVRNAFSIVDPRVPFPFEFLFMSAGLANALGHEADAPGQKLAGMQLSHFGGFLKRSWRANDWLWGRLDGVQHALRAVFDLEWALGLSKGRWEELAEFALPDEPADEAAVLERLWWERAGKEKLAREDTAKEAFVRFLSEAKAKASAKPPDRAGALSRFRCCQAAVAARIQLRVLEAELENVAERAAEDVDQGSSRIARGVQWAGRLYDRDRNLRRGRRPKPMNASERLAHFVDLDIGRESPKGEAGTRLGIGLGSQTVAVAAAMLAGGRGGLPVAVRGALATVRGLTLALSGFVRLLAESPPLGAAAVAVLSALVVWGLLAPNALLGTILPVLAVLVVAAAFILFTLATGILEQSLVGKRIFGFVVLLLLPVLFLYVVGAPGWIEPGPGAGGSGDFLSTHVGVWATRIASAAVAAAVLAALARLVFESHHFGLVRRRQALRAYRLFVVVAILAFAIGFIFERLRGDASEANWEKVADEQRGLLMLVSLLAVALLTAILVELLIPAAHRIRDRYRAGIYGRARDRIIRRSS